MFQRLRIWTQTWIWAYFPPFLMQKLALLSFFHWATYHSNLTLSVQRASCSFIVAQNPNMWIWIWHCFSKWFSLSLQQCYRGHFIDRDVNLQINSKVRFLWNGKCICHFSRCCGMAFLNFKRLSQSPLKMIFSKQIDHGDMAHYFTVIGTFCHIHSGLGLGTRWEKHSGLAVFSNTVHLNPVIFFSWHLQKGHFCLGSVPLQSI